MPDTAILARLIEPVLTGMGFALVRVQMNAGPVLQVMAEDPATGQLTLNECAAISHALDPVLDAADPIESEYRLEVSSPGIDRPLTRAEDWTRWTGHRARVSLGEPLGGRKRFEGVIAGLEADAVTLDIGADRVALPLAAIAAAKLVLTDDLIAATRPLSTEGADTLVKDRR